MKPLDIERLIETGCIEGPNGPAYAVECDPPRLGFWRRLALLISLIWGTR